MIKSNRSGFTLVEIMIVVVIIGLLAAMAIPAFRKVRVSSIEKTVHNDGRQLGTAAQQYMLEFGVMEVASEHLVGQGKYITSFSQGVGFDGDEPITQNGTFKLKHAGMGVAAEFNSDGSKKN